MSNIKFGICCFCMNITIVQGYHCNQSILENSTSSAEVYEFFERICNIPLHGSSRSKKDLHSSSWPQSRCHCCVVWSWLTLIWLEVPPRVSTGSSRCNDATIHMIKTIRCILTVVKCACKTIPLRKNWYTWWTTKIGRPNIDTCKMSWFVFLVSAIP